MDKIICWFSCGATSAVACKLAVDEYGKENCELVYIGIKSAHPDNVRFIKDCEKWIGMEVKEIRSDKYKDQYEVIEKVRYINGVHGAPCTRILKKNVRTLYEEQNPFSGQVFGFEFEKSEINRAIRFKQQYPYTKPLYPLIKRKMTKNQCAYMLVKNGIKLPVMYELGFNNNNCIGCVKGGMGYWNQIRRHFPEKFEQMSVLEQNLGSSCLKEVFLKDLKLSDGLMSDPVVPDCGIFCEIEFADLLDSNTDKVLSGELEISEI